MESGKYETIDRKFLDTFYRECGREVTLAYTVLNQTNTWAVTFFVAVLGSSLVALVKKQEPSGTYSFDYPNPFHWLYLILAWCLLLRFMQRSALALSNMYRWNELTTAVWEVAALPEKHPSQPSLNDALVELVDKFMINWREPRSRISILWGTLKLMYLFPTIILLGLILWGIVQLPTDHLYFLGLSVFIGWTMIEMSFYISWNRSGRQALRGASAHKFLGLFLKSDQSKRHVANETSEGTTRSAITEGVVILLSLFLSALLIGVIWMLIRLTEYWSGLDAARKVQFGITAAETVSVLVLAMAVWMVWYMKSSKQFRQEDV